MMTMQQSRLHPSAHDVKFAIWVGLASGVAGLLLMVLIVFTLKHVTSVAILRFLGICGAVLMLTQGGVGGALVGLGEPFSKRFPVKRVIWGLSIYWFLFPIWIGLSAGWLVTVPHSMAGIGVQIYMLQFLAMLGIFRLCIFVTGKATQKPAEREAQRRSRKSIQEPRKKPRRK